MVFEQIATGGCQSYLIGCEDSRMAALIDPEISQIDRYLGLAARDALQIHYLIDTHTHADHFSATSELARRMGLPVVMHRASPAPFVDMRVDDGEMIALGQLRLRVLHTPGHTADSICLLAGDRVFTGDTLLIGGTGRTDLPGGDPEALFESLFRRLLPLDAAIRIYPAHEYKGREHSSIGQEAAGNPRLQQHDRAAFVEMMCNLNLSMPRHVTEALRVNMTGGRSVAQLLAEAAARISFMSLSELKSHVDAGAHELVILDVREREAFQAGHIPGARLLPRGQLELRVNTELPDPTRRILTYCELGKVSTLATATLRSIGFQRAVALDGGMQAWRATGYPVAAGD
jgi:glyoxylase-like metal-dependent hydrolase (beta-lactamase superfamily II)/rhodanese-related sulfurtransferase